MPHFDSSLELVFEPILEPILEPIFEPIFEPFFNAIELGPRATDLGLFPREALKRTHHAGRDAVRYVQDAHPIGREGLGEPPAAGGADPRPILHVHRSPLSDGDAHGERPS